MKNFIALLFVGSCTTVLAATYTVPAGSSSDAIQAIVNMAGFTPGNTVMFSAGNYSLGSTISLPCANGTIYTGPNVGVVTLTNKPSAVLTNTTPTKYALQTVSNGTSFSGNHGCTIQFLTFSGTQGGIYVSQPSSGIVIRDNYSVAARSILSVSLQPIAGSSSMTVGSTMQLIARATYSDGTSGALPDGEGNDVTSWSTSDRKVAMISAQGHATAINQGPVKIAAMVGSLAATPMVVTVTSAKTRADQLPAEPGAPEAAVAALGPVPAAPAGPLPDNFIGPFWSLVSPNGGSASISNSHLFLGVPGEANHDTVSPSNQAVRVVQTIGNENFDVAIKIDSPLVPTDGNTSQGLMALSDNQDFITFALTTDGTRIGLKASTVTAGVATIVLDDSAFSQYQNPSYLRLTRTGTAYMALYSVDGAKWTQASSFTDSMVPTSIGPFASNYSDTPANTLPVVMSVNWLEAQ